MVQQLQNWLRWKNGNRARSHASTSKSGKWKDILQTGTRAPQKAQVYSKLMYQDKIKAKVDAMISESGNLSQHDKFNLRMKITKEMWEDEDEGVKAMVNEEVTKLTNSKLAEHQGERTPEEMAGYVFPIKIEYMITDLVAGQSNNYQILSALSFAHCQRRPGGRLHFYLVVPTPMMPRGTSMLLGMMAKISSASLYSQSLKTNIMQRSYHAGETALGNQFPAVHGDFQQTFVAPFTDFLINIYREL